MSIHPFIHSSIIGDLQRQIQELKSQVARHEQDNARQEGQVTHSCYKNRSIGQSVKISYQNIASSIFMKFCDVCLMLFLFTYFQVIRLESQVKRYKSQAENAVSFIMVTSSYF